MWLLLKNILFTVIAPGTVAVYLPALIVRDKTAGELLFLFAAPFFVVGVAIYVWTVWDFAVSGRATPAPIDAPKTLVSRGLYRFVRNPMYLGVLCVILGWAIWYRSGELVLYMAVVWSCFHLFVVLYEERHLRRIFGDQYVAYRERVGRWLPRLNRK
ncbi:MAG: isoprenylcysteine carboxylmethyltransferase family protein [Gammaproteobacteria bacterium]|nr:isoprenylcysteine carboxylmethyltransferase family protein [Gammaproteobacteria bacterium]MDH3767752.1 isoprenylcysteine carboxylmethyltransferase family protein [Gammaproteobacteria bacterium]